LTGLGITPVPVEPKLFREQLCFFDDIDYSEKVEYIGDEINEEEIRNVLVDIATTQFT